MRRQSSFASGSSSHLLPSARAPSNRSRGFKVVKQLIGFSKKLLLSRLKRVRSRLSVYGARRASIDPPLLP